MLHTPSIKEGRQCKEGKSMNKSKICLAPVLPSALPIQTLKAGFGEEEEAPTTRVGATCALYHCNYESSYLFLLYILYAFYHSQQGRQQTRGQRNEDGISKSERYQQWIMLMWW